MVGNVLQYAAASLNNANKIKPIKIQTYLPTPGDVEYSIGYIERYFVQKINDNDSPIYEISESYRPIIQGNGLYKTTSIRWRIKGVPQEIMNSNKKSIEFVKEEMPKLGLYLPNLLQFAKVN
jgi:hypothetical protein